MQVRELVCKKAPPDSEPHVLRKLVPGLVASSLTEGARENLRAYAVKFEKEAFKKEAWTPAERDMLLQSFFSGADDYVLAEEKSGCPLPSVKKVLARREADRVKEEELQLQVKIEQNRAKLIKLAQSAAHEEEVLASSREMFCSIAERAYKDFKNKAQDLVEDAMKGVMSSLERRKESEDLEALKSYVFCNVHHPFVQVLAALNKCSNL